MTGQKYFQVDVFSHHFVLSKVQAIGLNVVEAFARQYVQFGLVKQGRRFIKAPIKVFAARVSNFGRVHEYRFHIQQFSEFVRHLTNLQILPHSYEVNHHTPNVGVDVQLKVLDKWIPKDYQVPIINYLAGEKPSKAKLLETQTGSGKAQPLNAKIKTPYGWTTMGEVQVGDLITAWDGTTTTVTGCFPQGEEQVYRITFSDGRTTEASGSHLWKVYYINTVVNRRWRIVNTLEMMRLISMPNPRVYVPLIEEDQCKNVNLPIDPYVLGVVIGDGSLTGSGINITKPDEEIFETISQCLPEGVKLVKHQACECTYQISKISGIKNSMIELLKQLGLMGKASHEKFIPEIYLQASADQRLRLLQGLMDTDGTTTIGGTSSFSSTSLQLAENVQYIVRSLGGLAAISSRITKYSYKGELREGRLSYQVNIRLKRPTRLFMLKRKSQRLNDDNQYSASLKLRVTSIEPTRITSTKCISINHPDRLYITDDFIVTHNSFSAASAIALLGKRFVIIIKPMYMDKWKSDLKDILGLSGDDVVMVQGSASLMGLITNARTGTLKAKAIIISNRTLQYWYKAYEESGDCSNQGYDCNPSEFFSVLGVGVRLIDEVHQDFHLNFKVDLYTNVPHSISLSATLKSDDPFLNRMYELTYPKNIRYTGLAYNKYVHAYSWIYQVKDAEYKLRTTEWGSTLYSHNAFEKSIFKNRELLRDYLNMIVNAAKIFFIDKYKKGERLLIYCSSIQTCTAVVERLTQEFENSMIVKRYVENDPYENLMQADISVSTLLSAGTGVDIPGLKTVILTTSISSSQSNIQGFGRLRKIEDKRLQFVYFVCSDIPKHIEYHEKKKDMLKHMALSYGSISYDTVLGS